MNQLLEQMLLGIPGNLLPNEDFVECPDNRNSLDLILEIVGQLEDLCPWHAGQNGQKIVGKIGTVKRRQK